MRSKIIFLVSISIFLIVLSSCSISAIDCEDANVKVHFTYLQNVRYGNLAPSILVGKNLIPYKDSESIPIIENGKFIVDSGLLENVSGISMQRYNGSVRFLLFGSSRSLRDKEILSAEITFENATIIGFKNDNNKSKVYPYRSNIIEKQGDRIYILGNYNQDEVFPNINTKKALWYSTVSIDNDGFFLNINCTEKKPVINNTNNTNSTKPTNLSVKKKVYIVPYVGDIDGSISQEWLPTFQKLADFYDNNKIPAGFSFYPGTMDLQERGFVSPFLKMYLSNYIELIQKGYMGDELEMQMDNLSFEEQKQIIKDGQDAFRLNMQNILGTTDIELPTAYNQIHGRFTDMTLRAAKELGFKQYFDVFVESDLDPVDSTIDFDVIQYGISMTTNGDAGRETKFKSTEQIYDEINNYVWYGVPVKDINGTIVIPLWVHHQDFESATLPDQVDALKWKQYTDLILGLKADKNVILLAPKDVYALTHNQPVEPPIIEPQEGYSCQFASDAYATSENYLGSNAVYATGVPDALISGCGVNQWSGYGHSWTPSNWNIVANLTLVYDRMVYADNLTILGDYDMCFRNIWVKNSKTGEMKNIFSGLDNNCTINKDVGRFLTDRVILETCGWGWSSTDAVQVCGNLSESYQPKKVEICSWKNCKKGAVSISVDDYYYSCMNELEALGYRGTYSLTDTGNYSLDLWQKFDEAFKKGHEIATHTESHLCKPVNDSEYINDLEKNIQNIISHTSIKETDLVTHIHPCGYTTKEITKILQSNWNFLSARGYYFNALETEKPGDLFNLKSFNSHGYPGGSYEPPNYFTVINQAEEQGKWANLVFHLECDDDGVINYLPAKNVWVDTVGNIVKYIYLRNNSQILNYQETSGEINFKIETPVSMSNQLYNQNLTLKVYLNNKQVNNVKIGEYSTQYNTLKTPEGNYVLFDVPFPINDSIKISLI